MKKVVLVLVDGMRADSLPSNASPFLEALQANSLWTLEARTVMPSVTLPCHMSLFHSVTPERHGILTNTYVPQVRPVRGLCEVLRASRRKSAFFYNWEELRDLSRPASLCRSFFASLADYGDEEANRQVMEQALPFIRSGIADFTFVYLGWTDHAGHNYGWMGPEYMRSVRESMAAVDEIRRILSEDDLLVVTADHGGHDRVHGTERPEDMTIPLFFCNPAFGEKRLESASIIDIAPTITAYLGLEADPDWEGKNLLQ